MRPQLILLCILGSIASGGLMAQTAGPEAVPHPNESTAIGSARIPDSIMFTIDELNEIQSRMASGGADTSESAAIEDASLYLSTIVYSGPNDWTIWINGRQISAGQEIKSFEITDIGPRYVEFLIPLSAQGMRPVRLAPNQSFVTRSGAIVEGKWEQ